MEENSVGDKIGKFLVTEKKALPEINAVFYAFVHSKTNARYVHIERKDTENTFGVAFKTVPTDSTGVPHILEHTVLCGSKKYPVRDPFFSMIKRSLSTFMNAFTASDWTMYPFSTQNQKDFYNLMDVYLDAVFFPRLDRLSFLQESCRLELEEDRLVYKGVVYNEMKGALSSPDQILYSALKAFLYPDVSYRFNSGGVPEEITKLTYEELVRFHQYYYHPTNAFFYSYGNLPVKNHFEFIEEKVLSKFNSASTKIIIESQPRFFLPLRAEETYMLDEAQETKQKNQVCVAWLTADITDTFEVLCLTLLEQVLLGNPAAPLRKALLDSGLGSALCDISGYMGEYKDTFFACGLKDVAQKNIPEVKKAIETSLTSLVQAGIPEDLIKAAIHQLEFRLKEITNTPYPYGLRLLLQIVGSWISDGNVIDALLPDENFKRLAKEREKGSFFEGLIEKYLLQNPHQVELILRPDVTLAERKEKEIQNVLSKLRAQKPPEEILEIIKEAQALEKLQEAKENPEALPTLELSDVPSDVEIVLPSKELSWPNITIYEKATSGILYVNLAAGIGKLSYEEAKWLPFLGYIFTKMGTKKASDDDISRKIDLYTGGISFSTVMRSSYEKNLEEGLPFILIQAKALSQNVSSMFDLLTTLLVDTDFSKRENIHKYLLEYRAKLEAQVVQNGHQLAMSLASRNLSSLRTLSEALIGVSQVQFLKTITTNWTEDRCDQIILQLVQIVEKIFNLQNFEFSMIGSKKELTLGAQKVEDLRKIVSTGERNFTMPKIFLPTDLPWEGWSTSTTVSFVGASCLLSNRKKTAAPALSIASKMLRNLYLHREIREKGGAYGGFALYNSETGIFNFASYRDPHIARTLDVFKTATQYLTPKQYTKTDLKEAILQVCADLDKPSSPAKAALQAFERKLVGLTDEDRVEFKENLLGMTPEKFQQGIEEELYHAMNRLGVSVISNKEKLFASSAKLSRPLKIFEL